VKHTIEKLLVQLVAKRALLVFAMALFFLIGENIFTEVYKDEIRKQYCDE
jgi:hypothetical protein